MRLVSGLTAAMVLAALPASGLHAQSLGSVIKKSAERETKRQAERRTREAVQCVTGARDCIPESSGNDGSDTPPAAAAPTGAAASGADAYLIPSGTASNGATGAPAAPFTVAPIAGATAVDHQAGQLSSYRRITGFKPKLISYQDQTGLLTRTRYEMNGGQTPSAMVAAWREPLVRQGFVIEWQCSRKAQCGSSAYHQLGAGYMPVNGINLGIAGDVEYFTARRTLQGQPTVFVSIALNRKVAYVDVLEVAP